MNTKTSSFLRRMARNRAAMVGLVFLVLITLLSLSASLFFPEGPFAIVGAPFELPFGTFLFGTDSLGRSVAAGVAYGGRVSLMIGLSATVVSLLFGIAIGALAGYYGGRVDNVMMRLTEFFQTIPSFLFAIVLITLLAPSNLSIVIAISVVSWPPVARLVRGEFMRLVGQDFVHSAICIGMTDRDIILTEILPNALSPLVVSASLMIATAILTEAAVSFLGLGDPNMMSWGFVIGSGRSYLRDAWWICTIPGIVILLTVLAVNLLGETVNDAMNPRLRHG